MVEMTLRLPDTLLRLSEPERAMLIRAGLHEATRARIMQMKTELSEARKQLRRFESITACHWQDLSPKCWRTRTRCKHISITMTGSIGRPSATKRRDN